MNTNEKDIDDLTRRLMRDTFEQPSFSLNARIMARIMKEKRQIYTYYIRRLPSLGTILAIIGGYLLLIGGIFYYLFTHNASGIALDPALHRYFPVAFTVIACLSFFFLFTQLDKWLYKKGVGQKRSVPKDV